MPRANRLKRLAFPILALLIGLFLGIILVEIFCRIFDGDKHRNIALDYYPPDSVIFDSEMGWQYRPGYRGHWKSFEYEFDVAINSLGFRDHEYGEKRVPRLLFLGDSFTFGVGVNSGETFVKQVEQALGGPETTECINAGRIGAGSDAYRILAQRGMDSLHPDGVLVCCFPENDFDDVWAFHSDTRPRFEERDGKVWCNGELLARERTYYGGILFRNSAFYRLVRLGLPQCSIFFGKDQFKGKWLDIYLKDPPEWISGAVAQTFENLDAIRAMCQSRKEFFAIILIPSEFDLNERLWKRAISRSPQGPDAYDSDRPFRLLREYAEAHGTPILDLRAPLRLEDWPLHFKHDRHFNVKGHAAAARAIAPFIQQKLDRAD